MDGYSSLLVTFSSPAGHSSTHTIYCKVHSLKKTSDHTPNGRTLFTLGWPPYASKACLEEVFSRAGHVTHVILQLRGAQVEHTECGEGFKVGYVVMSSKSEVTSALKLCSLSSPLPCAIDSLGLTHWMKHYRSIRPSLDILESSVAIVMEKHDLRVKAAKEERMKAAAPDDDGWITVTSRGNRRKLSDEPVGKGRKQKKKELVNFYSWQLREGQRTEIAKLRQHFEEDKLRVATMRSARRFKPY